MADSGSWIEHGPPITSKRESSPLRNGLRGNWCLSSRALGKRKVSASLALVRAETGKAATEEFIFKASWASGGRFPRALPYWGVRQLAVVATCAGLPPIGDRSEAAGCPERSLLNRHAVQVS